MRPPPPCGSTLPDRNEAAGRFHRPAGRLGIRWPDQPLAQELRLQRYKVYAALAYARANGLNRTVIDSPQARFGIVTTGKSYLDVRQALDALGIDEALASDIELRILKVGMTWPLDAENIRHFAEGLEEILVVEEKSARSSSTSSRNSFITGGRMSAPA